MSGPTSGKSSAIGGVGEMDFVKSAIEVAERAVEFEKQANFQAAIYFYHEAVHLLERAIQEDSSNDSPRSRQLQGKCTEYLTRIETLTAVVENQAVETDKKTVKKSPGEILVDKAKFMMNQALGSDEAGSKEEAVQLYSKAIEFCLTARAQKGIPDEISEKLTKLATQALERAELLKGIQFNTETPVIEISDLQSQDRNFVNQRKAASCVPPPSPSSTSLKPRTPDPSENNAGGSFYTEEEKLVLLTTSEINGISYLPFLSADLQERFTYSSNFDDPDGLLSLSPKQRQQFRRWTRPHELYAEPQMIRVMESYHIKQTLISDCSFVASLAISANYEKRFKKKLIRTIIYPQNRAGEPIVNPSGKYMVLLNLNGVRRKILIDDMLPTGPNNQLLCSYSNNKGELWVSLLEKAYMKVMGGYDFPGSNSNIDLHALTGWIPERRSIANDPSRDKTFAMLLHKMEEGHVIATVATGELSDKVADRAGLVPTHAYAVLDVREVRGVKLFLLKNPWSHLRWRGNYSELDAVHWTEEMKRLLNYDPNNASMFDNGVFWIDYESLCQYFDVFYMNWDPELFQFTYCTHRSWSHAKGPVKDVYSIGENPQYSLELNSGGKESAVWILLTRHIVDIVDFKDNREYITVLVYENDGKKVYYPNDPEALIDGVRINSPHYLCKFVTPKGVNNKRYTLVISQYEKTTTIHYTLRVYASCQFKMGEIVNTCKHRKRIVGEWNEKTAGGCANYPLTTMNNPNYRLELRQEGKLIVDLKGPKEFNVGFDVICTNSSQQSGGAGGGGGFYKKSTGAYRPGFVVLDLGVIPAGIYIIIPSTFQPGCKGPFFLNIQSTSPFDVSLVP